MPCHRIREKSQRSWLGSGNSGIHGSVEPAVTGCGLSAGRPATSPTPNPSPEKSRTFQGFSRPKNLGVPRHLPPRVPAFQGICDPAASWSAFQRKSSNLAGARFHIPPRAYFSVPEFGPPSSSKGNHHDHHYPRTTCAGTRAGNQRPATIPVSGILDALDDGRAFVRTSGYRMGRDDVYVPQTRSVSTACAGETTSKEPHARPGRAATTGRAAGPNGRGREASGAGPDRRDQRPGGRAVEGAPRLRRARPPSTRRSASAWSPAPRHPWHGSSIWSARSARASGD